MSPNSIPATSSKIQRRIGWGLSALTILFMLFDAAGKLALEAHVVQATTKIGYPVETIRPIGVIALICTVLYAIPRTALLGAILLTGFCGGAVASKVRIKIPYSVLCYSACTLESSHGLASICATTRCAGSFRYGDSGTHEGPPNLERPSQPLDDSLILPQSHMLTAG